MSDLLTALRDFSEMPLEGGKADPMIETMNALAKQAADEIERVSAQRDILRRELQSARGEVNRLRSRRPLTSAGENIIRRMDAVLDDFQASQEDLAREIKKLDRADNHSLPPGET